MPKNCVSSDDANIHIKPESRMASLDVLRGIAILMVLVVHAPWPEWISAHPAGHILRVGRHGVDLFFVLSGYLISRLLFKEIHTTGSIQLIRFWMRRGFKIWPSYYIAYLSAGMISAFWVGSESVDLSAQFAWPNFVFLQNYIPEHRWFASWSLAIEEHFYTALPLLLLALVKLKQYARLLVPTLIAICAAVPVMRFLTEDPTAVYLQTHLRMDALCYGVLLGYCEHKQIDWPFQLVCNHRKKAVFFTFLAMTIPVAFPFENKITHSVGLSVLAIASAVWTGHASANPNWGSNSNPFVRRALGTIAKIGVYSYTIYLVQQFVIQLIDVSKKLSVTSQIMNSHGPQIAVFIGGAIVVGWALSASIERPFLALRERWVPKKQFAKDARAHTHSA